MTTSVGLVTGLSLDGGGLNGLISRGTLNNVSRGNMSPGGGGLGCNTSPQALPAHPLRSGTLGFGPHAMVNGSPYSDLGCTLPSYSRGIVAATTPLSPNNVSTSPSTPQSNSSNNSNNRSLSQDIINNNGDNSGTGLMTASSIAAALGDQFSGSNTVSGSTHPHGSLPSPHGGLDLPHSLQAASSPSLHGLSNNTSNSMSHHSQQQQQHHNNNYLYSPNHQESHGRHHHHLSTHGMLAPGPDGQSYLDLSPNMGHQSPGAPGSPLSPSRTNNMGPMYPWMAIVGKSWPQLPVLFAMVYSGTKVKGKSTCNFSLISTSKLCKENVGKALLQEGIHSKPINHDV